MGQLFVSIELVNPEDVGLARRYIIDPEDVRQIDVRALVDTGSLMMTINENIQEYLQLPVMSRRRMKLADGKVVECPIVGPILIRCMGEATHCNAVVMPDNAEPLLGAIPLEEMNLVIDLQRLELIPNTKLQRVGGWRFVS